MARRSNTASENICKVTSRCYVMFSDYCLPTTSFSCQILNSTCYEPSCIYLKGNQAKIFNKIIWRMKLPWTRSTCFFSSELLFFRYPNKSPYRRSPRSSTISCKPPRKERLKATPRAPRRSSLLSRNSSHSFLRFVHLLRGGCGRGGCGGTHVAVPTTGRGNGGPILLHANGKRDWLILLWISLRKNLDWVNCARHNVVAMNRYPLPLFNAAPLCPRILFKACFKKMFKVAAVLVLEANWILWISRRKNLNQVDCVLKLLFWCDSAFLMQWNFYLIQFRQNFCPKFWKFLKSSRTSRKTFKVRLWQNNN